jgi:SAM-dependent methyltransferase
MVGVDLRRGPGVDEVGDARWWRSLRRYDYVICMETLEHTPEPERVVETIIAQLAPGGRCIITCAGPTRPPHGCDGGPVQPGEHYDAIDPNWLRRQLQPLAGVVVRYRHAIGDVYATGVRR